ncbi:MAG: DUF4188 domain-containing protein [Betaproteobacteria bacterium]
MLSAYCTPKGQALQDSAHLPAWRAFNQAICTNGSVGIWHASY